MTTASHFTNAEPGLTQPALERLSEGLLDLEITVFDLEAFSKPNLGGVIMADCAGPGTDVEGHPC